MVGFFLPGDSLLVTAGLFAAKGDLNIATLVPSLILAAICGNTTGYWIGNRAARRSIAGRTPSCSAAST
jgi:membrane-associated protein